MDICLSSLLALTLAGAAPTSSNEVFDPFKAAETIKVFTFDEETDRTLDKLPQPVDWSRRRGPLFPEYVDAYVDPKDVPQDYQGRRSLRFTLNGGQATYYSPVIRIKAENSYVLEAWIRTEGLVNNAALVSLSFLNYKTERLERHLSVAVMGTHREFQRVRLGPINPDPNFKFIVIGCHLMSGEKMDIRGDAWFDDIRLGKLPLVSISTQSRKHFFIEGDPIIIEAQVGGRDSDRDHQLTLELEAAESKEGKVLKRTKRKKKADDAELNRTGTKSYEWKLSDLQDEDGTPLLKNGYYQVRAIFERDGKKILEKETTFAVMERATHFSRGRFGWSLTEGAGKVPVPELADVASQGGVNWLKYPLWSAGGNDGTKSSADIALLMERLSRKDIEMVGLLNDPPKSLMDKFARNLGDVGISKIFTMPAEIWQPSLEPVIASYSFRVRHWQLGGETDKSFIGMKSLPKIVSKIKREFDRVGRNVQIGVRWDWTHPLPNQADLPNSFLSLDTDPKPDDPVPEDEKLREYLHNTKETGIPRWVLLKPLSTSHPLQERAADLVRRMMVAELGQADVVFASNPFDPEHGLLHPDGSPAELFLPWRTAALALQGTKFLGKFNLPNHSQNVVFAKPGEVLMVVWNDHATEEKLYLGEDVTVTDLYGRTQNAEISKLSTTPDSDRVVAQSWKQQVLHVGPVPIIVRGCSEPVARWRLAMQFKDGRIPSMYGGHPEVIFGKNTFQQGVSMKVHLDFSDKKWTVEPRKSNRTLSPGEKFEIPVALQFSSGASIGKLKAFVEFEVQADIDYRFVVYRPYKLGLGQVNLEVNSYIERKDNRSVLVVEQIITNNTNPLEILNFNCDLLPPGQRRQKRSVVKLGQGSDKKTYWIPHADSLIGKKISLQARQRDGRRVLNKTWTVRDQGPPKKSSAKGNRAGLNRVSPKEEKLPANSGG